MYPQRINANEILIRKKDDEFIIPFADGKAKLSVRDSEFRESSEPGVSQPAETTNDAEVGADFWSIQGDCIYRHHTEPRVHLYVPERRNIPNPTEVYWRDQDNSHKSGCVARKTSSTIIGTSSWIEICRNFGPVSRSLQYWVENLLQDFCGLGGAWHRFQQLPDVTLCGLRFGLACRKQLRGRRSRKCALEKPKLDNARRLKGFGAYTHFPKDRNCEICKRTKVMQVPRAGEIWWLVCSWSQTPQRRMWISKQSPIRCRGTRFGDSVDPILSVQNQNFKRNGEELAKVLQADEETQSHLHWQFHRIWQILWRLILESLHVNTHTDRRLMVFLRERCAE